MPSTFETLPDEILMIILGYSGDAYEKCRALIGLNQRLNNILIDKRLHLLAYFLHIDADEENYSNSAAFQDVSQQLASIKTTMNTQQLRQCFQSLVVFYMKEQCTRVEFQIESIREQHKSVRQHLTNDESVHVDEFLRAAFNDLQFKNIPISLIERIKSLVLIRGARLECDNYQRSCFNLAQAINQRLLICFHNTSFETPLFDSSPIEIFQILIISNPNLLKNRDFMNNGGRTVRYFLFYSVYRLQYFYSKLLCTSIDIKWYQALVNLLILVLKCEKQIFTIDNWIQECIFDILDVLPSTPLVIENGPLIEAIQWSLFKIVLDEYVSTTIPSSEMSLDYTIKFTLENLIERNQLDLILFLYRHVESVRNFFNKPSNCRTNVEMMTENRRGRQLFNMILEEKPLDTWLTNDDLLFLLLDKKEHKLLEKLLILSPSLIQLLDKDGNDPLLYVCLKVHGDRYRIVELLIKMGCHLQRPNHKGKHFLNAIQLAENRPLLNKLIKEKVLGVNDLS